MKTYFSKVLLCLPALLFTASSIAAEFFETFDGTPSPNWIISGNPGYSVAFAGGRGAFSKSTGTPDGSVALTTSFFVDGDFTFTVEVDGRSDGALSEMLNISWINSTYFAQIYLESPQLVFHQIGSTAFGYNSNARTTDSLQLKFQITRVGTRVALLVDRGSGFVDFLSATGATFAGPVRTNLVAFDGDSGSSAGGTAYFDNFAVQAQFISGVPEPGSGVLLLAGFLWLAVSFRRSKSLRPGADWHCKVPLSAGRTKALD